MDVNDFVKDGKLRIIVKPNARKSAVVGYDDWRSALKVEIAARPENNEANIEVIKFFSKLLKKKVSIKSGLRSKEKILSVTFLSR